MAGVRAAGKIGEDGGIVKDTTRIPSATNTAKYRIPDVLNARAEVIGEGKNVSNREYTSQLKDFMAYAEDKGYSFELYVWPEAMGGTQLSPQLDALVKAGKIVLKYIQTPS